jgi:Tfp pilus assembly protein PilP|tara:strand:+ start:64 stop:309 length:246 start_codon:yes stop_codon:yes gene_type:complete
MKKITLLIVLALLSGCGETVYRTKLEVYCPEIKQYTPEFNDKLANELENLPADNTAVEEALKQYIFLRDRIRRCNEEKDKI